MEVPSINNLCIVANKKGMGWKRWFVLVGNGDELLSFILGPGWIYLVDGWIVWWTHDGQMMDTWHDSMMEAPLPTAHSATKVIPLEFRLGWLQWKPRVWRYSVLIICLSQSLFKTFFIISLWVTLYVDHLSLNIFFDGICFWKKTQQLKKL